MGTKPHALRAAGFNTGAQSAPVEPSVPASRSRNSCRASSARAGRGLLRGDVIDVDETLPVELDTGYMPQINLCHSGDRQGQERDVDAGGVEDGIVRCRKS